MLKKLRSVALNCTGCTKAVQIFINDLGIRVDMPRERWVEMGSPQQVTVTVRPGDVLNP